MRPSYDIPTLIRNLDAKLDREYISLKNNVMKLYEEYGIIATDIEEREKVIHTQSAKFADFVQGNGIEMFFGMVFDVSKMARSVICGKNRVSSVMTWKHIARAAFINHYGFTQQQTGGIFCTDRTNILHSELQVQNAIDFKHIAPAAANPIADGYSKLMKALVKYDSDCMNEVPIEK